MDIISHGLWGGAGFLRRSKKSFWTAFSFGFLPDLLAFGWFSFTVLSRIEDEYDLGNVDFTKFEPPTHNFVPQYVFEIYNYTHSLFIFAAIFILAWIIFKKPILEMSAWGLHILMDIPTHTNAFFPTPFLFPFSSYSYSGISWASIPFMIVNWSALLLLYGFLFYYRRKKRKEASL